MRSNIFPYLLRVFVLLLFLTLGSPGPSYSSYIEDLKARGLSFYLIHQFPWDTENEAGTSTPIPDLPARCRLLSKFPESETLTPSQDPEQIVKNIISSSEALEKSRDENEKQTLELNIAYEYYLLFLYFQKEKFAFPDRNTDQGGDRLEELHQYLMMADKYLTLAVGELTDEMIRNVEKDGANHVYQPIGVNFHLLRGNPAHLFNSGFLQLMIEVEKMAGEWQLSNTNERLQLLDITTWQWLENLYDLYAGNPEKRSGYLDPGFLFSLHDLYLRYHFLAQVLMNPQQPAPYSNSIDQKLFERLNRLQQDAGYSFDDFYQAYLTELSADGGNTTFLHGLYLARRWPAFLEAEAVQGAVPKMEIFRLFQPLFEKSVEKTVNSTSYRSRIYNELVIFGTVLGHPGLMEDVLHDLTIRSFELESEPDDIADKEIDGSARLTTAYLLSHLLELKWKSGIDHDIGQYEEIAENLSREINSKRPDLWRLASSMHQVFANYHAKANSLDSRKKVLHHATEAFIAPCRYLKSQNLDWQHFYEEGFSEDASVYLKDFIVYRNKYSIMDIDEILPGDLQNAKLIVQKYTEE